MFANELDFQDQLDAWFAKVNARTHKTLRARPVDRLAEEREVMAPLPARAARHRAALGDAGRRRIRYLRVDTNDYSLDPRLVGRRVEVRVDQREVTRGRAGHRRARLPARARRSPGTARSPRSSTPARCSAGRRAPAETAVEVRPLARYDALIA